MRTFILVSVLFFAGCGKSEMDGQVASPLATPSTTTQTITSLGKCYAFCEELKIKCETDARSQTFAGYSEILKGRLIKDLINQCVSNRAYCIQQCDTCEEIGWPISEDECRPFR